MSFTVSKNGRLALLNVATQVSLLTRTKAKTIQRCEKLGKMEGHCFPIFACLGRAPMGPAGPCAGEEVPGGDPGLLHHPLLLRGAE